MGTILYAHGVDQCFEGLNLTHPDHVLHVHEAYVQAGADVIQTNTYGANYMKLARYGLEDHVSKINTAAVRIAKQACKNSGFLLGNIGGIHGAQTGRGRKEDIKRSFREQLYSLITDGVDGLLLETYYDVDELITVLSIAREETNLPIIANVSMHESGILENGISLQAVMQQLKQLGADVVEINCNIGTTNMLISFQSTAIPNTD